MSMKVKKRVFLAKNGRFFSFFREFRSKKVHFWHTTFQKKSVSCTNFLYGDQKCPKSSKITKKKNEHKMSSFRSRTGDLYRKRTFFETGGSKNVDFCFGRCRVLDDFRRFIVFGRKWTCFFTYFEWIYSHISKKTQKNVSFLWSKNVTNLHTFLNK